MQAEGVVAVLQAAPPKTYLTHACNLGPSAAEECERCDKADNASISHFFLPPLILVICEVDPRSMMQSAISRVDPLDPVAAAPPPPPGDELP